MITNIIHWLVSSPTQDVTWFIDGARGRKVHADSALDIDEPRRLIFLSTAEANSSNLIGTAPHASGFAS